MHGQVVAATLSGAGDLHRLGHRRFKVVILDEASQATEPSTLIPLVSASACLPGLAPLLHSHAYPHQSRQQHTVMASSQITHDLSASMQSSAPLFR